MPFRLCEHIKTDGIQCHSPAMGEGRWCYYHHLYRRRMQSSFGAAKNAKTQSEGPIQTLGLPQTDADCHPSLGTLEDAAALQVAFSTVINALAARRLGRQRAATLLNGLRLASANLRGLETPDKRASVPPDPSPLSASSTSASPVSSSPAGTYAQVPSNEELEFRRKAEAVAFQELMGQFHKNQARHAAKAAATQTASDAHTATPSPAAQARSAHRPAA